MDILSVRRKALAAREAAVGAQAPSSPSSTSPGPAVVTTSLPMRAAVTTSLPMPAAVTTSLPMPAAVTTSLPMPAALASASALPMLASSTMPSPSTMQPAPAAGVPRRPTGLPADAGDPLQGFLAADDIDDEGIDDESERDFVEQGQRFLAFRIGAEEYAATIMDIKEILPVRAVTEVPRAPPDVLGVVNGCHGTFLRSGSRAATAVA